MNKYKVHYTGYDTLSDGKITGVEIVEANSEQDAKDIITNRSYMGGYDYYVDFIERV